MNRWGHIYQLVDIQLFAPTTWPIMTHSKCYFPIIPISITFPPKFSYWKWLEKSGNSSESRLLFTLSDYFSGWYSTVFLLTHPFWQILISLIEKYWAIIASVFSLLLLWKISKAKPKREWKGATVVIWVISFEVTDYQVLLLLPEIILKLQQQPSFLRCNSPLIFMPI